MELYDCIIIGGGPAGLNAAVVLGRCRRKVVVFDTQKYRNRYSHGMHNYLTRDDILPTDFIGISHRELEKYNVQKLNHKIINARKNKDNVFEVRDDKQNIYHSKKLLVATGLIDTLPDIEGFREFYGHSVFHCPYCDGWEVRDKKLGVYARDKDGTELAMALKGWTDDVTLFTDGKKLKPEQEELMFANDITINRLGILKLEGNDKKLEKIIFKNSDDTLCDALFFVNGYTQHCNLAEAF